MSKQSFYAIVVFGAVGCGPAEHGTLVVTAYGEPLVESSTPTPLDDGWAVSFSEFEIGVRDVTVGGHPIEVEDAIDLHLASGGRGHVIGSAEVPVGTYSEPGFVLTHILVAGSATTTDDRKTFRWRIDQPAEFHACETTIRISEEEPSTFEITIHADHLLFDSIVAAEPRTHFQAFADADLDGNGSIETEELSMADLGPLDPGSDDHVRDLRAWLFALGRTVAHVDGENHCHWAD